MAAYTADAVAMNRRLVGRETERVEEIFDRAESGVDVIEATPVQIAEVADTFSSGRNSVAGVEPALPAREAVRALLDGPVSVPKTSPAELMRLGDLYEYYTMHDAMLVSAYRTRQTDGILTNDEDVRTYDGDAVVW